MTKQEQERRSRFISWLREAELLCDDETLPDTWRRVAKLAWMHAQMLHISYQNHTNKGG